MDFIKVMLMAIIVCVINGYLKTAKQAFHQYIAIAACVIIMIAIMAKLSSVITGISRFTDYLTYTEEYIGILLKCTLITYVTSFTSDICRDSGYSALAGQVELFGKISIILISVPIIFELLDMTVLQTFGAEVIEYDYSDIDGAIKDTGITGLTFTEIVSGLLDGSFSVTDYIRTIITDRLSLADSYRQTVMNIVLIAIFSGAVRLLAVHGNADATGTSRMLILMMLVIILSKIYSESLAECVETISGLTQIYEAVIPVFLSSVAVVTGSITYAAYYQLMLLCITAVNNIFVNVLVVLIKADYYLVVMDGVLSENRFRKLSDLLESIVKWTSRAVIVLFTGIGCVKGIMAPMSDSFKRKIFYKTAKIIPGIGDSLDAVSSVIYGSGIIIKNGIGVAGMTVVMIFVSMPLLSVTFNYLMLKMTAALIAPVAEKEFVSVIDRIAGLIGLMMLLMAVAGLLFIILTGLICAVTNGTSS